MLLPLIRCIYGGETWRLSNEKRTKNWLPGRILPKEAQPCSSRARGASGKAPSRRNSDDGTMHRICSSTSQKPPDDVLGYFVDLRNDLDAFFMYLSSFYGVELHRRDSLIIFDEVQLYPKAREAIKQLVADGRYTTTSRQARSSPSARTSRTSSFHQRRSRSA